MSYVALTSHPTFQVCLNPGVTKAVQARLRGGRPTLPAAESLLHGLVSKAGASVLTYPLSLVKVPPGALS